MGLFRSCSGGSFVIIPFCVIIIMNSIAVLVLIRTDLPAVCVCERVKENESELACVCVAPKANMLHIPIHIQTPNC